MPDIGASVVVPDAAPAACEADRVLLSRLVILAGPRVGLETPRLAASGDKVFADLLDDRPAWTRGYGFVLVGS